MPDGQRLRAWTLASLPLAAAWTLSVVYLTRHLYTGWFPHDDGALAQSAERVLDGQLPHRDFDDIYTGGLDYVHGLAFELFGHQLTSLRLVLLAFFVAWVPALYVVARRFTAPLAAAALVLLCVVWSVPNYTASMPSWYNLFLATFALAAFLSYLETERRAYLALAGLACGISIVVKVTGVYSLVAIVLALLLLEQEEAPSTRSGPRLGAYGAALLAVLALVVTALVGVLARRLGPGEALDFLLPGAALCAFLGWNELARGRGEARRRFALAGRLLLPVLAGAFVPVALYALPYAASGSLGELAAGVLLEPTARLEFASMAAPSLRTVADALLPVVPAAVAVALTRRRGAAAVAFALALVLLPWLVLVEPETSRDHVLLAIRWAARLFVPVALVVLASRWAGPQPRELRIGVFALLAVAGWTALVQFPFSAPIYFAYAVPFFFLAVAAFERWRVSAGRPPLRPAVAVAIASFLLAVGVLQLNAYSFSGEKWVDGGREPALPRAGELRLPAADRVVYGRIVDLIGRHSRPGDLLYAGPDAPEVYFLADRVNPTRFLFEFLADQSERESSLALLLRDPELTMVVVNTEPEFSPSLDGSLERLLDRRLPVRARVGRFEVRWAA